MGRGSAGPSRADVATSSGEPGERSWGHRLELESSRAEGSNWYPAFGDCGLRKAGGLPTGTQRVWGQLLHSRPRLPVKSHISPSPLSQ